MAFVAAPTRRAAAAAKSGEIHRSNDSPRLYSSSVYDATHRPYQRNDYPQGRNNNNNNKDDDDDDMAYTRENIDRQSITYHQIYKAGGEVWDVYASNPAQSNTFWYVGKLSLCATVSRDQALSQQWNLVEQHARRIRPVELGRAIRIQLFVAPGFSELECSQNTVPLVPISPQEMNSEQDDNNDDDDKKKKKKKKMSLRDAGFLCEYVTNKGVGFFLHRNSDGSVPTSFEGSYKL